MTDELREPNGAEPSVTAQTDTPSRGRTLLGRVRSASKIAKLAVFGIVLLLIAAGGVALEWTSARDVAAVGTASDRTIKANESSSFESTLRTQEQRRIAYDSDANIAQVTDTSVRTDQVAAIDQALQGVETIRNESALTPADKATRMRATVAGLNSNEIDQLLGMNGPAWQRVRSESRRLVDVVLAGSLTEENVPRSKEELDRRVSTLLSTAERPLAAAIARPYIRANVYVDEEQTVRNRQEAAEAVDPVIINFVAGQVIVRDGDIVTPYDIEKLDHFGLLSESESWQTRFGKLGLQSLVALGLLLYLFRFHREVWETRRLLLYSLVVFGPLLTGPFLLQYDDLLLIFPIAASAMLMALLLNIEVAIVTSAFLSLSLGIVADVSLEAVLIFFLASVVGAVLVWRAERTMSFIWAGLAIGLMVFGVSLSFQAIRETLSSGDILRTLILAMVGGGLAASLTFMSFSLLGSLFGITTHLQLLELAHPNSPLLYRLAREAPGTYHHSIVVSNLAESGVEIVGGDPLFARVAVLYHDVGKIVRPTFFIENQVNMENPHDLLEPRMSAQVLVDHVNDGVRLAKKARLPQPMIDVIAQHHGNSLIRYFYAKALELDPETSQSEFRYPGPKPQSKEAGVVMLADSVEAAVRSASTNATLVNAKDGATPGKRTLPEIVDMIISDRIEDGQLNECDLTLREIEMIRKAFIQILEGIYHPRIEYPAIPSRSGAQTASSRAASSAG